MPVYVIRTDGIAVDLFGQAFQSGHPVKHAMELSWQLPSPSKSSTPPSAGRRGSSPSRGPASFGTSTGSSRRSTARHTRKPTNACMSATAFGIGASTGFLCLRKRHELRAGRRQRRLIAARRSVSTLRGQFWLRAGDFDRHRKGGSVAGGPKRHPGLAPDPPTSTSNESQPFGRSRPSDPGTRAESGCWHQLQLQAHDCS